MTPGTFELPGAEVADMYRPAVFARQAAGRITIVARSEQRSAPTPPSPAGGGWEEGRRPDRRAPSPQPPPARGGGGRSLPSLPSGPRLSACSPPSAPLLDYAFPPNLSRLASVGTEVLDRQDRPLALLPAAGGVWRFRADTRAAAAHRPADRRRGPPLLAPSRRRSARAGPRHRAVSARGPRRLRRLHARDAGGPPAASRVRAPSAPS